MFSKSLEINCHTAALTVSAKGNRREHEELAVFRVKAVENTALPRIHLRQITYLGMVRGSGAGQGKGGSLCSPKDISAIAGHQGMQ